MSDPKLNNDSIEELKRENEELKQRLDQLSNNQKINRRKSFRYLFSKKAAYIIIGRGLKSSLNQLYNELPTGQIKRDTFADVSAHLIWRLTRIGTFAVLIGILPLLILIVQTAVLTKQNKLFSNQNELFTYQIRQLDQQNQLISGQNSLFEEQNELFISQVGKAETQNKLVQGQNHLVQGQNNLFEIQNDLVGYQNTRIEQQTELIEADRRSSLVFLLGNIMDKLDEELKQESNNDRSLSFELIGRISALSQSLKPYRYLKDDDLIKRPLSPERGQLLLALVNSRLDTLNTLTKIFRETKFSRSDLDEVQFAGAYLAFARLTKANLNEANLNEANLKSAILKEAHLKELKAVGANFQEADLTKAQMNWGEFSGANFSRATLTDADLKNTELNNTNFYGSYLKNADLEDADMSEADLRGAYLNGADMRNVILEGAKVSSSKWFHKLEKWKVKGYEAIEANYELHLETDEKGEDYYVLQFKK